MPALSLPLGPTVSQEVVTASLAHLAEITQPGGRFVYAHDLDDITPTDDAYNLLRHSGTLWFMARAVNELSTRPDPKTLAAIKRATGFLGRRLKPVPWSRPEAPSLALVGKGMIKLGGVGLALLAIAEVRRIPALADFTPPSLPLGLDETIRRLRTYTLDEIDGDDFRHKRDAETGQVMTFRSDYYTGEAILGLLVSGEAEPELARVTASLMRRNYGWAQQSHWMAYAACEAIERGLVPEALGATYLTGLMEAIVGDILYRFRRQSTPIACRTEALTRVLLLSEKMPKLLSPSILSLVRSHAAENLGIQLEWYRNGQFCQGDNSVRVQIDYIQHNATSFLHWQKLAPG